MPSTDSVVMKLSFGVKPSRYYMRSMFWIGANRKKEDAAPVSMIGENCRSRRMAIIEFHLKNGASTCCAVYTKSWLGVLAKASDIRDARRQRNRARFDSHLMEHRGRKMAERFK